MTLSECIISLMFSIITVKLVTASVADEKWQLSHVFMHQDLPLCSQVALIPGYLTPCHVRSAEDEAALPCLVNRNCGQVSPVEISCSDGSFNKTCMPQYVSPDRMLCACSTHKSLEYHGESMNWTWWWSSLDTPYTGLYRELCDTISGECLAKEYRMGQTYLAKHLDLPQTAFSASSIYSISYYAWLVLPSASGPYGCMWVAESYDPSEWVQFDLGKPYIIVGVFLRKSCMRDDFYLRSFTMVGSDDGSSWTSGDLISVTYGEVNATHWFDTPLPSRRLWRIYPVDYRPSYPKAKADLIGLLND